MKCDDVVFCIPEPFKNLDKTSAKFLVWQMRSINKINKRVIEKAINFTGLYPGQHRLLMMISFEPNLSQVEIANRMNITPAAAAVSIKKLEKEGYVIRSINKKDNRFNKLLITQKGNDIIENSKSIFAGTEEAMFNGFSNEELEHVSDFFNRMTENMLQYYKNNK